MSADRRTSSEDGRYDERNEGGERDEGSEADGADEHAEGHENTTEANAGEQAQKRGRRDVIVPRELYKIVTVFSTLIAIVAVVGGFILLDTATNRTLAAASEVNLPLAIAGVGAIALGAATYAFASRFRTAGMGTPNTDDDEQPGNG